MCGFPFSLDRALPSGPGRVARSSSDSQNSSVLHNGQHLRQRSSAVLAGRSERRRPHGRGASWSEVPALVVHSRQVPAAGIARTEPVCLDRGNFRSSALQASLGVDCRGDPPRSAIVRQLASPARWPVVFGMRHGRQAFSSLRRVRAGDEG
jgi:hypothetical protein